MKYKIGNLSINSEDNEKTETNEIIEDRPTEVINERNMSVGLLSISIVFFILVITFFIIFVKHQKNAKKNVSK